MTGLRHRPPSKNAKEKTLAPDSFYMQQCNYIQRYVCWLTGIFGSPLTRHLRGKQGTGQDSCDYRYFAERETALHIAMDQKFLKRHRKAGYRHSEFHHSHFTDILKWSQYHTRGARITGKSFVKIKKQTHWNYSGCAPDGERQGPWTASCTFPEMTSFHSEWLTTAGGREENTSWADFSQVRYSLIRMNASEKVFPFWVLPALQWFR